jgi:WXG100 family type VII secretion target
LTDPGYTLEQFQVDLQQLQDAINTVTHAKTDILDRMAAVKRTLGGLQEHWNSPAFETFHPVRIWFETTQQDLGDMLEEIVRRLRVSHGNYRQAEQANLANVTSDGPPPPGNGAPA